MSEFEKNDNRQADGTVNEPENNKQGINSNSVPVDTTAQTPPTNDKATATKPTDNADNAAKQDSGANESANTANGGANNAKAEQTPPQFTRPTYTAPTYSNSGSGTNAQNNVNSNFGTNAQGNINGGYSAPNQNGGFNTRSFDPVRPNAAQGAQYNNPQYQNPQYGNPQYGNPQPKAYQNYYAQQAPQGNYNQAPRQNYAPQKPTKSGKKGFKVFCVILAVAVLLSMGVTIGYIAGGNTDLRYDNSQNDLGSNDDSVVIQQGTVPSKDGVTADKDGKYSADGVSKLVSDSVVNITVYSDDSNNSAIASGVIMDKSGYIISNDHIYSEIPNAKFVITLNDGTSYKATYVAGDSRSDLCVLKMSGAKNLTPATFADSSKIETGDDVIAIGSPYGLKGTVTKGIISAPSRRISFSNTINGQTVNYSMRVIQTDTALNSGNSGGALVNMYGQVIGISSSKIVVSGYEGLCFAIPSNDAIKTAKSLIANKKVVGRARLGITYSEITAAAALVNDMPSGLYIQSIDIDSSLYSSGLKKGDIITEINGTKITSADVALDIIDDSKAGDKMTVKVYIASTKSYKTLTANMLEDASTSSYSTQSEQQTTQKYTLW